MDTDCVIGNKCIIQSFYYSQCIPDTSSYLDISTGCVPQYGPCSPTKACCDPGAICASYNQCVQPQTSACVTQADILVKECLGRQLLMSYFKYD